LPAAAARDSGARPPDLRAGSASGCAPRLGARCAMSFSPPVRSAHSLPKARCSWL
jgi:hypothetical protein